MTPVGQAGGQHADDIVGFAVDANRAADDVGVTPEAVLPEAVTDHEDAVVAQHGFVGTEAAAELRLDAQDGKEVAGDAEPEGPLGRFAGCGKAHLRKAVAGHLPVAAHLGLQIEVVGRRDPAARVLGSAPIDAVHMIAVAVRQRAKEHLVEYAERRRVGADAESERDDGDEGEAGRATERPDGEAEVRDQHVFPTIGTYSARSASVGLILEAYLAGM